MSSSTSPSQYKEITVLDISDYHGQLVPLLEAADNLAYTAWSTRLSHRRLGVPQAVVRLLPRRGTHGSITIAAGDSVGATPPISAFFGDTPTIELMNLMGVPARRARQPQLRQGLGLPAEHADPAGELPVRVGERGRRQRARRRRAEWSFVLTITSMASRSASSGSPTRMRRRSSSRVPSTRSTSEPDRRRQQAEVGAARSSRGVKTIVVMGHDGATAGTLTNPTGPLIDLADQLTGVDAVIGDHTNFQVHTTRPNGTLVTENLSKGVALHPRPHRRRREHEAGGLQDRRLPQAVEHRCHRRSAIQARIDELNTQLQPILGTVVGTRQRDPAVRRLRAYRRAAVRIARRQRTTDAMRTTYNSIGVEFAITNSGGLRDRLTCAPTGGGRASARPSRRRRSDHPGPDAGGPAVRQRRGDRDDQRCGAQGNARERRLARCRPPMAASRRSPACASPTTSRPRWAAV